MIDPTIARMVWYHPDPTNGDPEPLFPDQPFAAILVGVHSVELINLSCFSHDGTIFAKTSVRLAQDGDTVERGMAEWMPFQKKMAARQDADEEKDVAAPQDVAEPQDPDEEK